MVFKDRVACFKAKDELLKAGTLYDDFEFLREDIPDVQWLRPKEITTKPIITYFPLILDVQAEGKGSRALVGALATISHRKDLIQKIFPDDQSFDKLYCGIFFFHFWRFGDWEIVGIDDRLPYNISRRELVCLKSMRPDVYFFSLFEKAYAKFKGGYAALGKLKAGDILVDLTGGVSQIWNLSTKDRDQWFPMMKKLVDGNLPATANIQKAIQDEQSSLDSMTTYILKNVVELEFPEEHRKVRLVRLGDPFGTLRRYTGAWNDDSPEWKKVPQHLREKLMPKDGGVKLLQEFWMTYSDFSDTFSTIHFCILSIEQMGPVEGGVKWALTSKRGQFPRYLPTVSNIRIPGATTYEIYPQYKIELTDVDDYLPDGKCELVVSLMQEDHPDIQKMTMGFTVFYLKSPKLCIPLKQGYFAENQPSGGSPISSAREITVRLRLLPGNYVLVVLTTPLSKMRNFLLRIYKHQRFNLWGHAVHYLNELDPGRKEMIPPSSRKYDVGPFDGPTSRVTDPPPRRSVEMRKSFLTGMDPSPIQQ
ncbi:hypothetical protein GE061_019941 [Apolygus lucorum]|uniref:Uncharacterized protein n=1 Tax=Apolygus lucorum TaxID=248454 RepID=A0A6A4JS97_APOLU|nr:hypothetical protein GE061_019941 [Apolygus lucorum]